MKVLATDLDRTLLPNGSWKVDPGAIKLFNEWTTKQQVLVVYVTGRNLRLTEQAIREYGVRYPDILCGDVGTSIRRYQAGRWDFDAGWAEAIEQRCPGWNRDAVAKAIADVEGLREQEAEHLNPFKQSYYVDHARRDRVLAAVEERIGGRYDEVSIYSFDSQNGNGLLDILPKSATKQTALEYVAASHHGGDEVLFCGDSGNDVFPLTASFCGVMVRNADAQLVEQVMAAKERNPQLKIYHAQGGFRGLNGYYVSGVLEGAYHYGILDDSVELDGTADA